jgi:hypothetical protein
LDFLRGKVQLDEKAAYNVRYRIKNKLKDFIYLQLPLIIDYERKSSSPLMKKNESVIILRESVFCHERQQENNAGMLYAQTAKDG